MESISLENILEFDKEYRTDDNNKIIENAIKNVGIEKVCLNMDVVNGAYNVFNIDLGKSKIYNQNDSSRCWIYAGINLIKNDVAGNLNISEEDFALSINYLAFLDKLEKANTIYNTIIDVENFDFDKEIKEQYLINPVREGGYFQYFRALVSKYGIVPETIMPDVEASKDSWRLTEIYTEKVKKDIFKLLEMKKSNLSKDELYKQKERMLSENFNLLSKALGELPISFDYEYKDKNNKCIKITNITPLAFSKKYLSINLNDFVAVVNIPMYNKEYNMVYKRKWEENVFEDSCYKFLNMPITVLKRLSIKQLKGGMPVYFSCYMNKMRDYELGIMDSRLYNYDKIFNFGPLSKFEAASLYELGRQHSMLITGVHIVDDKPIRWKIEDSYGAEVHNNGYYIMNDNAFDELGIEVIIDKKYLTSKELELFGQEPILYNLDEFF